MHIVRSLTNELSGAVTLTITIPDSGHPPEQYRVVLPPGSTDQVPEVGWLYDPDSKVFLPPHHGGSESGSSGLVQADDCADTILDVYSTSHGSVNLADSLEIRRAYSSLHRLLKDRLATSRERSVAITELETSFMWAIRGLSVTE
jgi:hypothetical protein